MSQYSYASLPADKTGGDQYPPTYVMPHPPGFVAVGIPNQAHAPAASSTAIYIQQNKCCVKAASAIILIVFLVGLVLFSVGVNGAINNWCNDTSSACNTKQTNILLEIGAGLVMMAIYCCIMSCCGCSFLIANLFE